jgi:hypothetical protein
VTTATIFTFDRGKYKSTAGNEPRVGEPWIYVWIDPASKRALYVGETGHSQRYDLRYRLRCSIGELASSTLRQVKRNANRTGFDVLAGELKTYAYPLSPLRMPPIEKDAEPWRVGFIGSLLLSAVFITPNISGSPTTSPRCVTKQRPFPFAVSWRMNSAGRVAQERGCPQMSGSTRNGTAGQHQKTAPRGLSAMVLLPSLAQWRETL